MIRTQTAIAAMETRLSRRTVATGAATATGIALLGGTHRTSRAAGIKTQRVSSMNQTSAGTPESSAPTVVFVHGAFADSSSWNAVIELLEGQGISTLTVANPLRGIAQDSAYLTSVLGTVPGPVLLVGHSYGGAVISSVPETASNVQGLVYIAAFALDEGEAGFDILGQFPHTLLGDALLAATADPEHPDVRIDPAQFHEVFAADLPEAETMLMARTQRPVAVSAFAEPSGPAAWHRLPTWYAVATADNAVGTEAERFFAERMGAETIEVDGSHVIMISQPAVIAELISSALQTLA